MEKKEILERIYEKDLLSEIKELKETKTKLKELEIKIMRKRYKNEIKGLKILTDQEIELRTKKQEKKAK